MEKKTKKTEQAERGKNEKQIREEEEKEKEKGAGKEEKEKKKISNLFFFTPSQPGWLQGYNDIYLPMTFKRTQEFVLVTFHS